MKQKKVRQRLAQAAAVRGLCNVSLEGEDYYANLWPLCVTKKLVLCARDADFALNGYEVLPLARIKRVRFKEDLAMEYSRREGVLDQLSDPGLCCDDWRSLFSSMPHGQWAAVERRKAPSRESALALGPVVKAGKKAIRLRHLDADGQWQEELWRIPYKRIVRVTFDERYINVYQKYAEALTESIDA